jgi:hypothetical protein
MKLRALRVAKEVSDKKAAKTVVTKKATASS